MRANGGWYCCYLLLVAIFELVRAGNQLNCQYTTHSYKLGRADIVVNVFNLSDVGLYPSEPCTYDNQGECHTSSHLAVSSNSMYYCSFQMTNYFIHSTGTIFEANLKAGKWEPLVDYGHTVTFDHATISGDLPGANKTKLTIASKWNAAISRLIPKKYYTAIYNQYEFVVPLRMPWDDCFNHLSFQTLPLIGAAYHAYQSNWTDLHFHCSMYTAALLNMIGVPLNKIIIERTIVAKQVLLPWVPKWIPINSASMKGITANVSAMLAYNLVNRVFPSSITNLLNPLTVYSPSHVNVTFDELLSTNDTIRYIVYNTRVNQQARDVYKEQALLEMISSVINKSKYRLVVIGHTHSYNTMELLQASWQRYAKVHSKAIVMMGPHGGGWNNIMFTPSDCHYIEFNHFPVFSEVGDARSCFLNAYHAKGGDGKYYTIEPNVNDNIRNSSIKMYRTQYMKVSQRQVYNTLLQINKDIPDLLTDTINITIPELSTEDLAWNYISPPSLGKSRKNKRTASTASTGMRSISREELKKELAKHRNVDIKRVRQSSSGSSLPTVVEALKSAPEAYQTPGRHSNGGYGSHVVQLKNPPEHQNSGYVVQNKNLPAEPKRSAYHPQKTVRQDEQGDVIGRHHLSVNKATSRQAPKPQRYAENEIYKQAKKTKYSHKRSRVSGD